MIIFIIDRITTLICLFMLADIPLHVRFFFLREKIRKDMREWEESGQWPLSCYSPLGNEPCLNGKKQCSISYLCVHIRIYSIKMNVLSLREASVPSCRSQWYICWRDESWSLWSKPQQKWISLCSSLLFVIICVIDHNIFFIKQKQSLLVTWTTKVQVLLPTIEIMDIFTFKAQEVQTILQNYSQRKHELANMSSFSLVRMSLQYAMAMLLLCIVEITLSLIAILMHLLIFHIFH